MSGRLQEGPLRADLDRLEEILETATEGSGILDAEIAKTFYRRRNLVTKNGELFWYSRGSEGPNFKRVPQYTRQLDAILPGERLRKIEASGDFATRWHASDEAGTRVDAATEPLARRLLALKTLNSKKSRRSRKPAPPPVKPEIETVPEPEDHRDLIISAMANEIKRISSGQNVTQIEIPDREIFLTRRHEPGIPVPSSQRPMQNEPLPLSELIEVWEREDNPTSKSVADMRRTAGRFIEINGDLPTDEIKKVHIRELLIRVRDLPRVMPQHLKNHTIAFGVEYRRNHPEIAEIAPTTVDGHRIYLSILFNWACRRDYMNHNPAAGFAIRDRRTQAEKRLPFLVDDLKLLFQSSTLYTGHTRRARSEPGPHIFRDGKFWMPLLGLFTGARVSELINLWPSDLRRESGVYYLDITKGGTLNTTKTQTSERAIPVHPELLKIGFVGFIERKEANGDRYVFPDLARETPTGMVAKHWSEKWRRIQKFSGINHPKKSFHSFRHTFKSACRASKIPEEIHDSYTGHKFNLYGRKYGGRIPVTVLSDYMETLTYPGLDLSHLYLESSDPV